jgi:hypothetical protein
LGKLYDLQFHSWYKILAFKAIVGNYGKQYLLAIKDKRKHKNQLGFGTFRHNNVLQPKQRFFLVYLTEHLSEAFRLLAQDGIVTDIKLRISTSEW